MSLQGSLDTFALPDVLVLLSSTKKDGELRVAGGAVDGRIWLEKGQIVHSEMGGRETAAVDALFELLRLSAGTFNFDADGTPARRSGPEPIDLVLADAQVRLGDWNEIARVVPHLDAIVDMAAEAPDDEVAVTREHWRLLRRVAGGRSVRELMAALDRSEFDACRDVKELVELRLASIDVNAKPKPKPQASGPAPADDAPVRRAAAAASATAAQKADAPADRPAPAPRSAADELEALAVLASRPAAPKVRASTSSDARDDRPAARSTAPEDAKAEAFVAQLAALSGADEEAVAAKVTEHLASGGELPEVPEGDEPINRGLLLKFLSSVRN